MGAGQACPRDRRFLLCAQSSLRANGDERLADSRLKDLVRLVETFGFYLCSLDVRQESTVHCEVCPFGNGASQPPPTVPWRSSVCDGAV